MHASIGLWLRQALADQLMPHEQLTSIEIHS
jgi:hypothetical protein